MHIDSFLQRTLINHLPPQNRLLSPHVCFLCISLGCQLSLLISISVTDCRFFSAQKRTPLDKIGNIYFSLQSLFTYFPCLDDILNKSNIIGIQFSDTLMSKQEQPSRKGTYLSSLLLDQLSTLHIAPQIHLFKSVSCDFSRHEIVPWRQTTSKVFETVNQAPNHEDLIKGLQPV